MPFCVGFVQIFFVVTVMKNNNMSNGFYSNPHAAIVPYMMPLCPAKFESSELYQIHFAVKFHTVYLYLLVFAFSKYFKNFMQGKNACVFK